MRFDIVIVGAGLAGTSFAAALRGSGLSLALVEGRVPANEAAGNWDSRVYAVTPASAAFLGEIGVWQHLDRERLTPVHAMRVRGDAGGELNFSSFDCGASELAWIAEAGLLQRELWESVKRQANLKVFRPAQPRALRVEDNRARLDLEDGRCLEGSLIVAADGPDSWVRIQAGLDATTLAYGETGVVANFACARPHRNTAYQWFRADGTLAWLPLPGDRLSMVWSARDAFAGELLNLPAEALCRRVAEAGEGTLGALSPLTPAAGFALRFMRVPQIVAPRIALIGDAAHTLHPLSGHGVNLGFQDARCLAQVIQARAPLEDCGSLALLRRHARARAEEVALLQWTTHGLQRLFRPAHDALRLIRNLGLNLTDRLPVLRTALARYAMGQPNHPAPTELP